MNNFKPTFLYIKQHSVTGLLYFGKTTKNPEKYKGSGKHWKRHLNKHGTQFVETLWYCLFTEQQECSNFATMFSEINKIVDSADWANLIVENGVDGAPVGHPSFITNQQDVSRKISEAGLITWSNPEYKAMMVALHKELWTKERKDRQSEISKNFWTEERRKEHSEKIKGKPGTKALKGIPKTEEHNRKNSEALKGRPKTKEHILKLKIPKNRVCRIFDQKEMSVGYYTRWLNSLIICTEPVV